jgi:hypothetical protein
MFKFAQQADESVRCLLRGCKMAAVITAGGGDEDGADLVQETFRRFAHFSEGHWLGALIASNVNSPESIRADADLLDRARAFGQRLLQ